MNERVWTVLRGAVAVALVIAVALVTVLAAPGVVGAESSYVVLSGSMAPAIQSGDVVVVREASPKAITEGDVITFYRDGPVGGPGRDRITHRVVEKRHTEDDTAYVTRGDGNGAPDTEPVPHSETVGEVWFHVPAIGHLILFAREPLGIAVFLVGPGLLLLGSGLRELRAASTDEMSSE